MIYRLPSNRNNPTVFQRFLGAVETRIADRQRAMWSRFIGSGFLAEDIEYVGPEENMQYFCMKYAGHSQAFRLADLNLRELDELAKWLRANMEELATP